MEANGGLTLLSTLYHADGKETRTACGYPLHIYSEETAAVEKSRKDVEPVTCKPYSQVNVIRTAQTNCTDDSDILHAHLARHS